MHVNERRQSSLRSARYMHVTIKEHATIKRKRKEERIKEEKTNASSPDLRKRLKRPRTQNARMQNPINPEASKLCNASQCRPPKTPTLPKKQKKKQKTCGLPISNSNPLLPPRFSEAIPKPSLLHPKSPSIPYLHLSTREYKEVMNDQSIKHQNSTSP